MRLLFFGDIIGKSGRTRFLRELPGIRKKLKPDFIAVNGENAAGGFGITETIFTELLDGQLVENLHAAQAERTITYAEALEGR